MIALTLLMLCARPLAAADVPAPAPTTAPSSAPAPLPDDARLDLFLLIGQSNMAGRGKVEDQDRIPDPRIWTLDSADHWIPATDPLHFDKPKIAGVGLGRTFAKQIVTATPGASIGLIPSAFGGTSIDEWKKGGKLYTEAVRRAREAAKHGTLQAILWHQGESDSNAVKAEAYPAKLKQLVADLRADLHSPDLPFIVGQIGEFYIAKSPAAARINELLTKAADEIPHLACVSSAGLTHIGDNTHFDAASQRELGRRYAAAYRQLTNPAR